MDEISERIDLPEDKIDDALRVQNKHISMDAPIYEGEEGNMLDTMVNNDSPMADYQLLKESLKEEIHSALNGLSEREKSVIEAFYGIGMPEMTLDEIGSKYGLTRERVRQIKEKAIRRLRNTTYNEVLKTYLG